MRGFTPGLCTSSQPWPCLFYNCLSYNCSILNCLFRLISLYFCPQNKELFITSWWNFITLINTVAKIQVNPSLIIQARYWVSTFLLLWIGWNPCWSPASPAHTCRWGWRDWAGTASSRLSRQGDGRAVVTCGSGELFQFPGALPAMTCLPTALPASLPQAHPAYLQQTST